MILSLLGDSYTYRWPVPQNAGPAPGERQESKLRIYNSHRDEITDTNVGLFGAIIVVGKDAEYDDDTLTDADGSAVRFSCTCPL